MSAVIGVLNESLTEAIKSFYKLRKAYITLEGIMDAEAKYVKEKSKSELNSRGSPSSSRPMSKRSGNVPSPLAAKEGAISGKTSAAASKTSLVPAPEAKPTESLPEKQKATADEDDDFDFVDADEAHPDIPTPLEYTGHLGPATPKDIPIQTPLSTQTLTKTEPSSPPTPPSQVYPETSVPALTPEMAALALTPTVKSGHSPALFGTHPVDILITSGTNFCFGVLQLIMSLVPPAFATLLKIVGFKGDRERGIQMLWQASKYENIHGAMAGLVLFGFYNALLGSCDIVPPSGPGSYPKERCKELLVEMRERYPKSGLWLLEESRMLAADKKLEEAVQFMEENAKDSGLKQLDALKWFERALITMYMHDYDGTTTAFLKCVELNNWSHGLYYYICGAAHVEAYRRTLASSPQNPALAASEKEKAKQFFEKAAPRIGKKKFMARQLPFDVFVSRKLQKWEARSKAWDCDLIDAVGVSPLEELIYFWNGYKRMAPAHLTVSLENLAWVENAALNPHWDKEEGRDEKGILALLRAATLRGLDRTAEARDVLQNEIITYERALFKGPLKDSWTAPCARYEMAACIWREVERDTKVPIETRKTELEECRKWLEEVANWESYDLDAR
jgi:hypothetical protein